MTAREGRGGRGTGYRCQTVCIGAGRSPAAETVRVAIHHVVAASIDNTTARPNATRIATGNGCSVAMHAPKIATPSADPLWRAA
ncbi:hypothetical protein, partial [Burkholderia stabilis]